MITKLNQQNGAALIVCLILLLVMTILGVSSITSTTMEEKMAGNIRNKHLSFQAAEAALRNGETIANGLGADTNFNGTNGLYPRSQHDDADFPIWEQASGINWQDAAAISGLVQNPQYIVEDFGDSPRDNDCMLQLPIQPGCLLPVYRVTAQGWGLNTNGYTMLQSTYKQL
jgi:type IV pilus assembly protein PilX